MQTEKRGAANAPQNQQSNNSLALQGLQELRDIAFYLANKYRFDPMLGRAHEEYLTLLNSILTRCKQ